MNSLLQLPAHNSATLYDSVSPECLLQVLITSPERAPQSMPHLDTLKDGVRLGLWMHGSPFNGKHWSGNILNLSWFISHPELYYCSALSCSSQCAKKLEGCCVHNYPIDLGHTHAHTRVLTTWLCICDWFFFLCSYLLHQQGNPSLTNRLRKSDSWFSVIHESTERSSHILYSHKSPKKTA